MPYHVPKDPFGKVRAEDLCGYLGYPREKTGGRYWRDLSWKTITFRKDFIKKTPAVMPGTFPIDLDSPIALECAQGFLQSNHHLFKNSLDADKYAWPTDPQDRSKILTCLTKLMCLQELTWRKNQNAKEAQELSPEFRPKDEEDFTDRLYSATPEAKEAAHTYIFTGNKIIPQRIAHEISVHLEYAYPLHVPPAPSYPDSLFSNNPDRLDLDRIDPFCFRYLHENCLYQSRRLNNQAIDRFVDNLYSHFNMTYTDAEWTQRRVMCKAFIRRIVRRWMGNNEGGFGFLNEVRGVIKKTPEFIAAWRTRRKDWIQTIHSGLTNGLLETRKGPSSYSPMDKKRNQESISAGSSFAADVSTPKRQRLDISYEESPEGSTIYVEPRTLTGTEVSDSANKVSDNLPLEKSYSKQLRQQELHKNFAGPLTSAPQRQDTIRDISAKSQSPRTPPRIFKAPNEAYQATVESCASSDAGRASLLQSCTPEAALNPLPDHQIRISTKNQFAPSPTHITAENAVDLTSPLANEASRPISRAQNYLPVVSGLEVFADAPPKPLGNSISDDPTTSLHNVPGLSNRSIALVSNSQRDLSSSNSRQISIDSDDPLPHGSALPTTSSGKDVVTSVLNEAVKLRDALVNMKPSPSSSNNTIELGFLEMNSRYGSKAKDLVTPTEKDDIIQPSTACLPTASSNSTCDKLVDSNTPNPSPRSNACGSSQTPIQIATTDDNDTSLPSPISRSGSMYMPRNKEEQTPEPANVSGVTGARRSRESIYIVSMENPNKPSLQFAIEDLDGIPDEDQISLISALALNELDLAGMFDLVAVRSGNQPEDVTFRYQWGGMAAFVVNRDMDEEAWRGMKKKMGRVFKNAKEEYRKKKMFLVWVSCGDRTILREDSGDEED